MKTTFLSAAAIAAVSVNLPTVAFAQSADEGTTLIVDEIVVTAQKQEQSLIDVPINVSVASQARIDKLAMDDLEDLGNFIPGLQVQAQSLNAPSYSLRGVVSDGDTPRVALFQNGVAVGNPGYATNLAIFDLERVEVVKGPQATLFGQGALVGGINFIQNRASLDEFDGKMLIEAGSYNAARVEGHINMPLSDTLAVRVSGQVKNMDGYVENIGNSPDLMGQDTTALRAAVHWEPVPRVTADFFANYQKDDSTGTQFKSGYFVPEGGDLSPYTETAMNINDDQVRDKLGNDRNLYYFTSNIEVELSDAWTMTSLTDVRDLESLEAWDSDGATFNLLQFYYDQSAETFSQELRFNYDAGGKVSAFFGGNYFNIDGSEILTFSTDEAYAQSLFAPDLAAAAGMSVAQVQAALAYYGVPGGANFGSFEDPLQYSAVAFLSLGALVPLNDDHLERSYTDFSRTTYDLFGDITYDVTDRLELTAGLRYTQEELSNTGWGELVSYNETLSAMMGGAQLNAVTLSPTFLVDTAALGNKTTVEEDTDGAFTWRLNAAYRLSGNVNTWIAYGRGRRPETLSASGSTFELVDAETLDNVEAGIFGRFFDGRLQSTSSIYYGQYKDFQTTTFDPVQGTFVTENSGNATQYGFEFDGEAVLTENLRVYATYAYTYSEYDDEDSDDNPMEFAGNKFRISPENSYSVAAEYTLPVSSYGQLSFVPSYIWKGDHFFEDDNGYDYVTDMAGNITRYAETYPDGSLVEEYQDAYGVANLRVTFDSADERWGLYLLGENVFDEEYLIDVGNTGGSFGLSTIIRGKPRMLKLGAYVNF